MQVGVVAKVTSIEHTIATHYPLVSPVPDEAAKHAIMGADFLPIFLEVA